VLLQPLFDSSDANNLKSSEEKKTKRTANQILFKEHPQFCHTGQLINPLQLPNEKMVLNIKAALKIHSKLKFMSCGNIVTSKH